MSLQLDFAAVPFSEDGFERDLYLDPPVGAPEDASPYDYPRKGMIEFDTVCDEGILPLGLSLNSNGTLELDRLTHGVFLKFTKGADDRRFVLLDTPEQRQRIEWLRAMSWIIDHRYFKYFLEALINNCDAVLKAYGNKAALIVT